MHLFNKTFHSVCISLSWVRMIFSVDTVVSIRERCLNLSKKEWYVAKNLIVYCLNIVSNSMSCTHHMHPLFLALQFPELVWADVDEWGDMSMICTGEASKDVKKVWCSCYFTLKKINKTYWSCTMTSWCRVYWRASLNARSLASDLWKKINIQIRFVEYFF